MKKKMHINATIRNQAAKQNRLTNGTIHINSKEEPQQAPREQRKRAHRGQYHHLRNTEEVQEDRQQNQQHHPDSLGKLLEQMADGTTDKEAKQTATNGTRQPSEDMKQPNEQKATKSMETKAKEHATVKNQHENQTKTGTQAAEKLMTSDKEETPADEEVQAEAAQPEK